MRKSFKVILDCDDVLYECNQKGLEWVNKEYDEEYTLRNISSWGLLGNRLDERLKLFHNPAFVSTQPLYPGAQDFVAALAKRAEVVIATNVPPQCAGARIEAIVRDFPQVPLSNILIGGRKDLLKADMMLDDAPQNMEGTCVRYPVLFRQPWNSHRTGQLTVSNYEEFLTLVDMIKANEYVSEERYDSIVLVGPSGSGKKQIAAALQKAERRIERVCTYATVQSAGYHYLTEEEFDSQRGLFFETSTYMGHQFGTNAEEVQASIDAGNIPLLVMDVNGLIAMKTRFRPLGVFVKADKEHCIREIAARLLSGGMPMDETVQRIAAIDAELQNEDFCDLTVDGADPDAIKQIRASF